METILEEKIPDEEKIELTELTKDPVVDIKEVFLEKLDEKIVDKEMVFEEEEHADIKPISISEKVLRVDVIRQIRKLCDKTGQELPDKMTKLKKRELQEHLARLMNASMEAIGIPTANETKQEEPETVNATDLKEDMIINALFRFGLLGMDSLERVSKLETVKQYTGGMVINDWSNKFKKDPMLEEELKNCLREIYAENDWLSEYLDCWSRLYLLLGMTLISSVQQDSVAEVVGKNEDKKSTLVV